jgi:hypothetical protein
MSDLKDFLENIRKFSPKIGEVAMRHVSGLIMLPFLSVYRCILSIVIKCLIILTSSTQFFMCFFKEYFTIISLSQKCRHEDANTCNIAQCCRFNVFSFIKLTVGTLRSVYIAVVFTLLLFLSTDENYIFCKN